MRRLLLLLALISAPAQAQQAVSGMYKASPPTLSDGQQQQILLNSDGSIAVSSNPASNPITSNTALSWDNTGFASRGIVMDDCQFNNGSCGWGQLFTPSSSAGTMWGTVAVISRHTQPALSLRSPDVIKTSSLSAGAIKRMNILGSGNYLAEFKVAQENRTLSFDRPAQFVYEVDTADAAGHRCLFQIIDMIYNQTTSTQVNQLYLGMNSGGNYLVGSYTAPTNENKLLPMDFALAFTIADGTSASSCKYAGLQVSQGSSIIYKLGVFNSLTDTTLTSLGNPPNFSLTSFSGGFNSFMEIINRTDATNTAGVLNLIRQRSVYLGSTDWLGTGIRATATPVFDNNSTRNLPVNHPLDRWSLATGANINTPEVEVRSGEKACFDLTVEGVGGSPTTSSLTTTFQVAAIQMLGNNFDSYANGNTPVWQTVAVGDGLLGGGISPADWQAITQATTTRTIQERCFTAGPNAALVRLNIALTSTGGSGVTQQISVAQGISQRNN